MVGDVVTGRGEYAVAALVLAGDVVAVWGVVQLARWIWSRRPL